MGDIQLNYHNDKTDSPVKLFKTKKLASIMPRRGFDGTEWNCVKCNQINYRQNRVCYRCGVNKAVAEYEVQHAQIAVSAKQRVMAYVDSLNAKHKEESERARQEAAKEKAADDKKSRKRDRSRSRNRSRSYSRE